MNELTYHYQLFDAAQLLEPVKESNPVGSYLRYDDFYEQIGEQVRREAHQPSQILLEGGLLVTDWQQVCTDCFDILRYHSKDLQIAAWLVYALLKTQDVQGLKEGLQLLNELIETYWETIHPQGEDDDEVRLSAFIWLDKKLPSELSLTNLAPYPGPQEQPQEQSKNVLSLYGINRQSAQQVTDDDEPTEHAQFLQAALHAPRAWHASVAENLEHCRYHIQQIKHQLQQQFSVNAPTFSALTLVIDQLASLHEMANKQSQPAADSLGYTQQAGLDLFETNHLFTQLQEISMQLREKQPHCPTGYLIQQAVNSRSTPLHEIIHLLPENSDLREQAACYDSMA